MLYVHFLCLTFLLSLLAANVAGIETKLQKASFHGHTETVKALLRKNFFDAKYLLKAHPRGTALMLASSKGHIHVVEALLQHNPTLEHLMARSYSNQTALHLASIAGHTQVVQLLLQHHPESQLSARDDRGYTPLMRAIESEHEEVVDALLAVNVTREYLLATNDAGQNALLLALIRTATQKKTEKMIALSKEQLLVHYRPDEIEFQLEYERKRQAMVDALLQYLPLEQQQVEDDQGRKASVIILGIPIHYRLVDNLQKRYRSQVPADAPSSSGLSRQRH